ncbi:MAG TPA: YggS family pyridoxal phosphate-dependent enzyme [Methyloradius sp.]|nr:YggS family pyridoxal phosphate-dependent enzyme [Methyloradius sp.]
MNTIADRLQAVRASITQAALKAGRNKDAVMLLAVSKAHPAAACQSAFEAGQKHFGENYVQEALQKQAELQNLPITWHFIGPIQSNKTQLIAQNFAWVHGVDRLKIAERLNAARPNSMAPLQICIQVNVSNEETKSGLAVEDTPILAEAISKLPNLKLRGLMAIPAPTNSVEAQQKQFRIVAQCFDALVKQGYAIDTLSMGMSDDFEMATAEGATIVRIGSAIFGTRQYAI